MSLYEFIFSSVLNGLFLRSVSFCAAGFCAAAVGVPVKTGPSALVTTMAAVLPATWRNSRRRRKSSFGVTSDSRMSGAFLISILISRYSVVRALGSGLRYWGARYRLSFLLSLALHSV